MPSRMNNYNKFIGSLIKQLREINHLSAHQLINKLYLDINTTELTTIEKGLDEISINDFNKIANSFNLDADKVYNYICKECKSNKPTVITKTDLQHLTK